MEHPKAVGDRSTLAILLALHAAGYVVALPFGENTRYDLLIDDGQAIARVQCKTGRLRAGAVRFPACSSYEHHARPKARRRDYLGQIDFFGVHCPETGGVYLVPIADALLTRQGALRVEPPRNNQRRGIRLAADYEIGSVDLRGPKGLTRSDARKEPGATSGA